MALIKCPECGKENVSDSAEACPACGFGIREYFEKENIENKEKSIELEVSEKLDEKVNSLDKEKLEKEISDKVNKAENRWLLSGVWVVIWLFVLIFTITKEIVVWRTVSICFAVIGGIVWIFISKYLFKKKEELKWIQESVDKYLYGMEERQREQDLEEEYSIKAPKCPICGSTKTERITTFDRVVSVTAVGIASSKIGKQYQCKICKHKW